MPGSRWFGSVTFGPVASHCYHVAGLSSLAGRSAGELPFFILFLVLVVVLQSACPDFFGRQSSSKKIPHIAGSDRNMTPNS